MEKIIIAILFLYPGAIVDILYANFAPSTFEDSTPNGTSRTAKYAAYSIAISLAAIRGYSFFFHADMSSMTAILDTLSSPAALGRYFLVSLASTGLFALCWHWFCRVISCFIGAAARQSQSHCTGAWQDIMESERHRAYRPFCIVRIRSGSGEQMGFCDYLPEQFERGFHLRETETVMQTFERDQKMENRGDRYIEEPYACYYDSRSNTFVELYDGEKLRWYLWPEAKKEKK